jgi:GNAT superfamily N-acetyltransferase
MGNLEVVEVQSRRDRHEMVMFPWSVYRGDKNWVPPIIKDQAKLLDPERNPFFGQADVALLAARRDGRLVGTTAVFVDHRFNAHLKQKVGFFGFFEALNDYEAVEALLDTARDWASQRGMNELRGPLNFHRDRERGILVEGDDCPPPMLCAHSPPYYKEFMERFGMVKYADDLCRRMWVSKVVGPDGSLPPRVARLEKVARRRTHLTIRHARLDDWDNEVQRVRELYDATIGQMPDHVPWSDEDINSFAEQLRPFVDPDFALFGEIEGKTVGCLLAFPDFNQVLIHLNGRIDGIQKLLAWWHMKRIDVISLKVGGVLEQYQGRGIEALFLLELARCALPRGFRMVDMSLQAEENDNLTRLVSHFDVEDYKRYRVYKLPL